MAITDHVSSLRKGPEAWREWRRRNPSVQPDLSGADLSGELLDKCDLRKADLSGANLRTARLNFAKLEGADLIGANLRGAVLLNADLMFANLHQADLQAAILRGASLGVADLSGADLSRSSLGFTTFLATNLTGADLSGVGFIGPCSLDPETVKNSGGLPEWFLRGCGWPERLIEYWPSIAGEGIEFYSGFISYSHRGPDISFARRLHDQLQGRGIRVWRDEHEVVPGDSVMVEIDRAIRYWDKTLLCCSEASLTSWWVEREIEKAIRKERELYRERGNQVLALIPLDLDGYLFDGWKHEYRSYLTERQAADFTDWESDNTKFEKALELVVRAMTPGGAKPPPPEPKL